MAKRPKTVFACTECGAQHAKWFGKCPECGAWDALTEEAPALQGEEKPLGSGLHGGRPTPLPEVRPGGEARLPTGIGELDRALGGGLVPGAVILIGGEPGVGKSTLQLQMASALASGHRVLYVTGEESSAQVAQRADRLGVMDSPLQLLAETDLDTILGRLQEQEAELAIVDSVQTVADAGLQSAPGSVAQVRECAARLVRYAKQTGTILCLVGHVTKEGALAGPRVLEHMVDTVLYFEGEQGGQYRLVRAMKNRFGSVNELGVFRMTGGGLEPVTNPSALFLSEHEEPVPGAAVVASQEGTRPLLVELQALVAESPLTQPRRVAIGVERDRLSLLLAVLYRHAGVALFDQDVFINVVGGVDLSEPAADLAVAAALVSSLRSRALPERTIILGEVGLAGEVRAVGRIEDRLKEAAKLGFKRAVIPAGSAEDLDNPGLELQPVRRIEQALELLLEG
ncbi:DNA repair protein RadA [Thiohalorhabdus methylotrophus]|uniref:DNA repair protein RadA n=1 Tax=Thiohalorhabdus methylotrophus TaxID=3242694 RepID=A0ABV4U0L5_9GAMM